MDFNCSSNIHARFSIDFAGQMGRWADGHIGKWADGQMGTWTDGQMDRWADGQLIIKDVRRTLLNVQLIWMDVWRPFMDFNWFPIDLMDCQIILIDVQSTCIGCHKILIEFRIHSIHVPLFGYKCSIDFNIYPMELNRCSKKLL